MDVRRKNRNVGLGAILLPITLLGRCCLGLLRICCPALRPQPRRCGTGIYMERKRKWIEKDRKSRHKREPVALRSKRRALSPISKRELKQQQSRLPPILRLPLELREQIYFEVLGGSIIHLTQLNKRLGHNRCNRADSFQLDSANLPRVHCDHFRQCFPTGKVYRYHHAEWASRGSGRNRKPKDIEISEDCTALLRTCHQIYRECIKILYEANTFDVNHPQTVIFLARTIRPQRLEAIQYLQITWNDPTYYYIEVMDGFDRSPDDLETWDKMWGIVGKQMKGLRSLKLVLSMEVRHCDKWRFPVAEFLGVILRSPQHQLRGLHNFELEVHYVSAPRVSPESLHWLSSLWNVKAAETSMRAMVTLPRLDS